MKITYKMMEECDIQHLIPIMKAAFDSDTRMHTDLFEDGPKGYDNGELLKSLLKLDNAISRVVYVDGILAGGYTINRNRDEYSLDMLFIDPNLESKGIGSSVWNDIEKEYADVKQWIVETPDYSTRNHHFYEKCGFYKVGQNGFEGGSSSIIFKKVVHGA